MIDTRWLRVKSDSASRMVRNGSGVLGSTGAERASALIASGVYSSLSISLTVRWVETRLYARTSTGTPLRMSTGGRSVPVPEIRPILPTSVGLANILVVGSPIFSYTSTFSAVIHAARCSSFSVGTMPARRMPDAAVQYNAPVGYWSWYGCSGSSWSMA